MSILRRRRPSESQTPNIEASMEDMEKPTEVEEVEGEEGEEEETIIERVVTSEVLPFSESQQVEEGANEQRIETLAEEARESSLLELDYSKIEEFLKKPLRSINDNIIATSAKLSGLTEQIGLQQQTIDRLEETNRQQQKIIQTFQSDIIQKTKAPLLMELIQLGDGVRNIIEEEKKNSSDSQPYNNLLKEVSKLESWIDSILEDNSVVRFQQDRAGEFNSKNQEVTVHEEVVDAELVGKVSTVSPGYNWTIPYLIINSEVKLAKVATENRVPQKFTFVLRAEEVKQYINKE